MADSHRSQEQFDGRAAAANGDSSFEVVTPNGSAPLRRPFPKAQSIRAVRLSLPGDGQAEHRGMGASSAVNGGANGDGEAGDVAAKLAPHHGILARKIRNRVRAAMRERYLTQWDVASACGITQSTLSAWLCGRKDLSGTHLLAVLETLEIDLGAS